ncbi:MAG: hypothetical protein QOI99_843, partial [Actinomycetota bacterium]|nr:hypothetical protein [Actinomycetota bacterium]
PNGECLDWLTGRLEPEAEAAFLQYHAAAALLQAVRELDPSFSSKLATAVGEAVAATAALDGGEGRARLVHTAREELQRRPQPAKA